MLKINENNSTELNLINEIIVPLVNSFRKLQTRKGTIEKETDQELGKELLLRLIPPVQEVFQRLGQEESAEAFEHNVRDWINKGLTERPEFDTTLSAYTPPENHCYTFFIAPFKCTNGPVRSGYFLECFYALREEDTTLKELELKYPHPFNGCQATRLILGSEGLMTGNCIVFFPENVATKTKINIQNFALFFFNKFYHIYQSITRQITFQLVGEKGGRSFQLTPRECYSARCIWGYLHDYYHHRGPRPIHSNLQTKLNFFVGMLEEIKVDCQTIITAFEDDIPYGLEIVEFILYERLLRYPTQPDVQNNFDSGTGLLMLDWLISEGYGVTLSKEKVALDLAHCIEGLRRLVEIIERIEMIDDHDKYKEEAIQFVRKHLKEGEDSTIKYEIPSTYKLMSQGLKYQPFTLLEYYDLQF